MDNEIGAKDPAFLFYSGDFLNGIIDMTMEERGQYITLLCLQHQKGHLSEKTIRFILGSVSVSVLNKFQQDNEGLYFNKRLESEISKRANYVESRRENGKKGGRPKKPYGLAQQNHMGNENENENKDKKEGEIKDKDTTSRARKNSNSKKHLYGEYQHVMLTDPQYAKLVKDESESRTKAAIKFLDEYIQEKGYKSKDHNLTLRKWVFGAVDERAGCGGQPTAKEQKQSSGNPFLEIAKEKGYVDE